jgi:enterochelin esterase-like enzyme
MFSNNSMKGAILCCLMLCSTLCSSQDSILSPSFGKIHRYKNFKSKYVTPRNIDVWIPDDFCLVKKYDVLYMQDGQNLFDTLITQAPTKQEWKVDEALHTLLTKNEIRACIVVSIWNTPRRRPEYFPQKAFETLDTNIQRMVSENIKGKPESDAYLQFLVKELKPFIDKNYHTFSRRSHTHIAGSSMGGLISLYALCEYPRTFGNAACISTHWVGCPTYRDDKVSEALLQYYSTHLPSSKKHRIYFDYGTENLDGQYEKWQLKMDDHMRKAHFSPQQWQTRKYPGEGHSEQSWSKRMDVILTFLLSRKQPE